MAIRPTRPCPDSGDCADRASPSAAASRRPPAPNSSTRNSRLPRPMPCSPVQVPPIASARRTSRVLRSHASCDVGVAVRVDQDHQVEIAVADVAEQRDRHRRARDVLFACRRCIRRAAKSARTRRWRSSGCPCAAAGTRSRRRAAPATAASAPRAASPTRNRGRRARARSPASASPAPRRRAACRGTRTRASAPRAARACCSD